MNYNTDGFNERSIYIQNANELNKIKNTSDYYLKHKSKDRLLDTSIVRKSSTNSRNQKSKFPTNNNISSVNQKPKFQANNNINSMSYKNFFK